MLRLYNDEIHDHTLGMNTCTSHGEVTRTALLRWTALKYLKFIGHNFLVAAYLNIFYGMDPLDVERRDFRSITQEPAGVLVRQCLRAHRVAETVAV